MITAKVLIARKKCEDALTTQYTATNCKAIIDKFTITNTGAGNVTFTAYLVASGGAANADECIINARSIAPNECYLCPELVGQMLESGGFIATDAGDGTSLTISASGREITQ